MKYTCITSMTQGHVDGIGGFMIDSFRAYWPQEARLIVYAEGFDRPSDDRVEYVDWYENCVQDWRGYCEMQPDNRSQRFAKKGFAWLHAMENLSDSERMLWLDADLLFKKTLPVEILENVIPAEKLLAVFDCFYQGNNHYTQEQYLDRTVRQKFGAESGFVVVNTQHERFSEYRSNYRTLFTTPKDPCFTNWYDGEVVLAAARDMLTEVEDLSRHRVTNKTQTPLNHCYLNEYMGHVKAKSKKHMTREQFAEIVNLPK